MGVFKGTSKENSFPTPFQRLAHVILCRCTSFYINGCTLLTLRQTLDCPVPSHPPPCRFLGEKSSKSLGWKGGAVFQLPRMLCVQAKCNYLLYILCMEKVHIRPSSLLASSSCQTLKWVVMGMTTYTLNSISPILHRKPSPSLYPFARITLPADPTNTLWVNKSSPRRHF